MPTIPSHLLPDAEYPGEDEPRITGVPEREPFYWQFPTFTFKGEVTIDLTADNEDDAWRELADMHIDLMDYFDSVTPLKYPSKEQLARDMGHDPNTDESAGWCRQCGESIHMQPYKRCVADTRTRWQQLMDAFPWDSDEPISGADVVDFINQQRGQ